MVDCAGMCCGGEISREPAAVEYRYHRYARGKLRKEVPARQADCARVAGSGQLAVSELIPI